MANKGMNSRFDRGGGRIANQTWINKGNIAKNKKVIEEIPTAPTYKVYRALLSQSGTNAPTALVLENTTSLIPAFTRESIGVYNLLIDANNDIRDKLFTSDKHMSTVVLMVATAQYLSEEGILGTSITIQTVDGGGASDDLMTINGSIGTPFEFLIYD
jgi:hypothetical protein